MEMLEATEALASLSQETRLRVFKLLLEYGRDGVPAGKIAEELDIPDNTLSFHLSHMSHASLVTSERDGRTIRYFANCEMVENLIDYLRVNCCAKENPKTKRKPCIERKC